MKVVKRDLPTTLEKIDVYIFADEHIGDEHSNIDYLKERIEYVRTHDNCYCILGGDIIDNATKTSIGDIYTQTLPPQQQIDLATELFKPISKKILCSVMGNHEARTYKKEGIDPMNIITNNLGINDTYSTTGVYMFLRFGSEARRISDDRPERKGHSSRICYTFYITHGSGGGRKEGAKAIRLADLASIADAQIYLHNHTHLPMIFKEDYFKVSMANSSIAKDTRLFVNSSANLEYGGYGETLGCKPACIDKPVVHLDGTKRFATATL